MNNALGKKLVLLVILVSLMIFGSIVYSHCQVPCGIYDDQTRFDLIAEHITTIEKSMKQVTLLSETKPLNMNQIVRWVQNKETHADELSQIVTYYFMAQRLKPVSDTESRAYREYVHKLTLLHEMLVFSMKAKQTTDLAHVAKLRTLLTKFHAVYFEKES